MQLQYQLEKQVVKEIVKDGFGKWTYTDKTTYEGNWVGTQKQGQGIETWPNGYIYKGEFKNSVWSGKVF